MNEAMTNVTGEPVFYGKPLRFTPGNHSYRWDGQAIPSVTGIIGKLAKPALIQWAADCAVDHINARAFEMGPEVWDTLMGEARTAHTRIRDAAGDVGTEVHAWAKAMMSGSPLPPVTDDAAINHCISGLNGWLYEHKIEPIACERRVMSLEHWYAGTCDFFGEIDGSLAVLDFKTGGKRIYDEAWLQTTAYELALREELGLDADNVWRWVVHIDKETGKVTPERRLTASADVDGWLHLVGYVRSRRQKGAV